MVGFKSYSEAIEKGVDGVGTVVNRNQVSWMFLGF